jgi:hypothetical protein
MPHGHTRIESKGACVYCGSTGARLSDEHIVPYSLGGQHILSKASCDLCADVTKKFEQHVARDLWGDARASYNAPTRRKKDRANHLVLPDPTGGSNGLSIQAKEYPAPLVFYHMQRAGMLDGLSEDDDRSAHWKLIAISDDERLRRFQQQYPSRLTATFRHVPSSFARLIAKIGYGQILTSLDPWDFRPLCLDYIFARRPNVSHIVGSRSIIEPVQPGIGYSLRSNRIGSQESVLLVAEVRLLANCATPTYHVVVGDAVGEEQVATIRRKLDAFCAVEVTEPFAAPEEIRDQLHWIPNTWPIGPATGNLVAE